MRQEVATVGSKYLVDHWKIVEDDSVHYNLYLDEEDKKPQAGI